MSYLYQKLIVEQLDISLYGSYGEETEKIEWMQQFQVTEEDLILQALNSIEDRFTDQVAEKIYNDEKNEH